MIKDKTAVVIGAGIGGLATSVYLAKQGFTVKIFEKNSSPGGRCGQIIRDGFRFDLGATMLLMPGIYHEVFDFLNLGLEEGKDIVPLENLYSIYFDDGKTLVYTKDKERMKSQLETFEPGSYEKSEKYVSNGYKIFRLGMDKLIGRNFYNIFQFANFKNLGMLARMKIHISNWRYAEKFFRNPHLLMAYTFQNIYVGQSPFSSPALFSMVPAAELTEGSFFPEGGMFAIVEKLFTEARTAGAEFSFNSPVSQIVIRNKKAEAVVLEDGTEIKCDIVIANADLPYVYRKLLPDRKKSRKIDSMKYSCSAICYHWGLDKAYPELDHHNVFLSDSYKEGLDRIFRDKSVNEHPSFYVHAPVKTDKNAAPEGCEALSIVVAAGHCDKSKEQDWEQLKDRTRKAVIERLKKQGLTDIEDHIKFEICHTPEDWMNAINISRGSVFGSLGHDILQMGYFRPHNRHDRYHNIYFTGGSTHPGNGIPNVLMSARLVSERIMKEKKF